MDDQLQKTYPRDAFMHLLNTIALYASVFSVLNLLFEYITAAFPDQLNPYYNPGDSIRWTLSLFLIIFGVFVWTSRFIEKDLAENPYKNDLKLRKWLMYLTIFLAALLCIGDLVALVYNFLGGDLTAPFILKILSVLAVGGAVFWYYLYNLKKIPGEFSPRAKIAIWGSLIAALLVIAYGFYLAGSPFKQRLVRFDNQRVSDLQMIQSQLVYYWQQKDRLPASLEELKDPISGFTPPNDPESGAPYSYEKKSELDFSLCAVFDLPFAGNKVGLAKPVGPYESPENYNWSHGSGNVCFDRHIDPELYRNNNNAVKPLSR